MPYNKETQQESTSCNKLWFNLSSNIGGRVCWYLNLGKVWYCRKNCDLNFYWSLIERNHVQIRLFNGFILLIYSQIMVYYANLNSYALAEWLMAPYILLMTCFGAVMGTNTSFAGQWRRRVVTLNLGPYEENTVRVCFVNGTVYLGPDCHLTGSVNGVLPWIFISFVTIYKWQFGG